MNFILHFLYVRNSNDEIVGESYKPISILWLLTLIFWVTGQHRPPKIPPHPFDPLLTVFPEGSSLAVGLILKHEYTFHRHQWILCFETSVGLLAPALLLNFRCSGSDGFARDVSRSLSRQITVKCPSSVLLATMPCGWSLLRLLRILCCRFLFL